MIDRSKLTPLALEVTDARDAILRVLVGLRDDRKAMMALSYATASYADHLSAATGHRPETVVAALMERVMETLSEGVMTIDLSQLPGAHS